MVAEMKIKSFRASEDTIINSKPVIAQMSKKNKIDTLSREDDFFNNRWLMSKCETCKKRCNIQYVGIVSCRLYNGK